MHRILALAVAAITATAAMAQTSGIQEPEAVSMVQLVANPSNYDGRYVQVIGFVRFEFEGNAIYLHEEDYEHLLMKNGLWLSMEPERDLDGRYALIEGFFNARDRGHLGLWSGSIERVTRATVWPPSEVSTIRDRD